MLYQRHTENILLCIDSYSSFIDPYMCANICILFHTDISPLPFSVGDYVGL